MKRRKNVAIVLAAGQGKRMNSDIPKQFLLLGDKPVLFYSLDVFQKMDLIDEIILVTGENQIDYCKTHVVDKYNFNKVSCIVAGGSERYLSVFYGIKQVETADNVLVHDGARPFITSEVIERALNEMERTNACIVAVPVKDTVKIIDRFGYVSETPERKNVWSVQTPQIFKYNILLEAYEKLMTQGNIGVTDDAMVVEQMLGEKIKIVPGDYRNIKITTPEDIQIGNAFINK